MKTFKLHLAILGVALLLGNTTQAQYRCNGFYTEQHDGAEYKKTNDSFKFYFSGSHAFNETLGLDIPDYYAQMFIESLGEELDNNKYPQEMIGPQYASDSIYSWRANASGTLFEEYSQNYVTSRNEDGNITSEISQNYSGGTWVGDYKYIYSYNTENQVTQIITQNWSGGAWTNNDRKDAEYTGGKMTKLTDYSWSGGAWVADDRKIYEYEAGNCVMVVTQYYSGGTWINQEKTSITYNSSSKIVSILEYNWSGGAWVSDSKMEFTYNTSNQLTEVLAQNYVGGAWENDFHAFYSYSSGQKSSYILKEWSAGVWDNKVRKIYTYGSNGKIKDVSKSNYNIGLSEWVNDIKINITYNSNNLITTIYYESWNTSASAWEKASGNDKYTFLYESYTPSGIEPINLEGTVNIFPNPANNSLQVQLDWTQAQSTQIGIYDMSGKLWKNIDYPSSQTLHTSLDISALPAGAYFLNISTPKGNLIKKFQVIH